MADRLLRARRRGRLLVAPVAVLLAVVAVRATAAPQAQALRTCVDRWNQGHMVGWGSMSVRVAVRPLSARERSGLSMPGENERRCTVSLADKPGDNAWICRLNGAGAYDCPLVTSDGMPPLEKPNGTTGNGGVLRLDVRLTGTHPTPLLAWQRRYPHVDGYILPWTRAGHLRPGLRFDAPQRGPCGLFVEHRVPRGAGRCLDRQNEIYEPCFAQRRSFRVGDLAACGAPGYSSFARFVVTRRI